MLKHDLILDGANPGANLGADFSASINETQIIPKAGYLKEFILSLKGDLASTTTVAMESFLNVLNPFTFKKGQDTRLQLRGRDLFAYSVFMTGAVPHGFEGAAGEDDKVSGLVIPVWEKIDPNARYSYSATRVAVTNVSGEVMSLMARYSDKVLTDKFLTAVPIPYTTAASTGNTDLANLLPQKGELIGLIVFQTTVPTAAADSADVQRVTMLINDQPVDILPVALGGFVRNVTMGISTNWIFDVLNNYRFYDFRDDPLDLAGKRVGFRVDVETASEAVRIIPVIQAKHE